jgi:hypothetical protein
VFNKHELAVDYLEGHLMHELAVDYLEGHLMHESKYPTRPKRAEHAR